MLLVTFITEWIVKKEAMGGGDIKFIAAAGAFMGWENACFVLFVASLAGCVGFLFLRPFVKKRQLPFGPYLAIGVVIAFVLKSHLVT